ncbi:transporter substrate-binding domain-containing protein [Dasania sp. GY-MA-18]|uniref:Transporter substrate-binding domain-containing protein n=1 Tax=Dasania phycosphaerae TaxID=2950436 RepID=A0A9J6RJ91_9GAMM|nr:MULTISPECIES: transporter substrate-binding domain-containing protein [Dasania]MCR8921843.1 transporter substrate-binding domain-containing protein [Dasania sp. GY-MA-18]MCZ0864271.1 transporter substrate-binding domain-containing protein [Dasania phycosphaerae]MCZ0867999.1 transporter substrate-binding domain-containing protein [Dasania phycosphaerae]
MLLCQPQAYSEEISLVGEEYCPHNCQPNSNKPGYLVEIAQQIFTEAGYTVTYNNMPWSRALHGARYGEFDAVVSVGPAEAPGFIFTQAKMGYAKHNFYTLSDNHWQYTGDESLNQVRLGAIQDYSYGTFYYRYIVPHLAEPTRVQVIGGNGGLVRNLKKLAAGRIDVLVEDQFVMDYYRHHEKLGIKLRFAGVADEEDLYIAFSPARPNSRRYAQVLNEGYERLVASGQLELIMAKYFPR